MKINTLQIIRALAALAVVVTHVFQKLDFRPFGDYILSGQYGVDIFFILSGFLIYLTTKKTSSVKSYTKKRLYRIYPLYLLALIFYSLVLYDLNQLELNFKVLFQNILMIPWDTRWTYNGLIIGVAWSTLFELFFYTIFFFILYFKVPKRIILYFIPFIFIVCTLLIRFKLVGDNIPFVSLLVSLGGSIHIFKFLIGCIIAELFQMNKIPKISKLSYKFLLITSIIFMCFTLMIRYNVFLSMTSCTFLFVVVSQYEYYFNLDLNFWVTKLLIYLGDISYSIYIIHILVIKILISYFGVNDVLTLLPLTFIMTIMISCLTYKFVEVKFMNLAKEGK